MVLKILKKRERYHSPSDSISSPESEGKNRKWTLARAPPVSKTQILALTATPAHYDLNFPPTSTPCLRAAPPFQLSQTLLSPVSKENPDNSFKVLKPGKDAGSGDKTFDNLLTSQSQSQLDSPSKLVVNRREKPLSRRNNEADVERTRQYAGGRIGSNIFTEDGEKTALLVVPSTSERQKNDPLRRGETVSESATKLAAKLKVESLRKKVLAEEPCNSKDSELKKRTNTTDPTIKSKRKLHEIGRSTVEQNGEEVTEDTQSPMSNKDRREKNPLSQVEERKMGDVQKLAEQSIQNGGRSEEASDPCICNDSAHLRLDAKSVVAANTNRRNLRNKSSIGILREVRRSSAQMKSSPLREPRKSNEKENLVSGPNSNANNYETFHLKQQTNEKDNATKQKRKSVSENDKFTPPEAKGQKDQKTKPVDEEISSLIVSKTSNAGKIKEQAVVCEDNCVPTQKRQKTGEDKSKEEDSATIMQTRRSGGKSKDKTLEDVDDVLNEQKAFTENREEFLAVVGLTPNVKSLEENSVSSGKEHDVADTPSKKDGRMKNLEKHKAKFGQSNKKIANACSPEQEASNRSVSRGRGLASGKIRESEESVERSDKSDSDVNHGLPLSADHPENDVTKSQRTDNKSGINDDRGQSRSTVHADGERASPTEQGYQKMHLQVVESSESENSDSTQEMLRKEKSLRKLKRVREPGKKKKVPGCCPEETSENNKNKKKPKISEKEGESNVANEQVAPAAEERTKERPKRERRQPGDYWIPNLAILVSKPVSKDTDEGVFKIPTLDCVSGSDDSRPRKKRKYFKTVGGGRRRSEEAANKPGKPAKVRTQAKKRRLLSIDPRESQCFTQSYGGFNSKASDSECTDGMFKDSRCFPVLISHANDVTLRNKNSGHPSENSKVRIGSTVSWRSLSGSLIELDSGAVSGPQVDALKHQVYIVIEGSIVFQILGNQEATILSSGDSTIVPAGYKFTVLNNGSNKARLNVINFTETI